MIYTYPFFQAFPCLTSEAAHGYVMLVRAQNSNKLAGEEPPSISQCRISDIAFQFKNVIGIQSSY